MPKMADGTLSDLEVQASILIPEPEHGGTEWQTLWKSAVTIPGSLCAAFTV